MRILRVEHKETGLGPYREIYSDVELDPRLHRNFKVRPMFSKEHWNKDIYNMDYTDHYFAFKNMTQLRRWFRPKCRKALHNANFHIVVLQVPDNSMFIGTKQVIFEKGTETIVESIALNTV